MVTSLARPFEKVLVANRGEIARRVMRTCKRLGIATVAVYSEADRDAPHVTDADEAVAASGPPPAKDSYLNVDAIARGDPERPAPQAVHPGYGFLSEKPAFARAVADAGAVFIGPPPAVLDAFGDKMKARHVALAAGTRPVPGTDEPIAIDTAERASTRAKAVARARRLPGRREGGRRRRRHRDAGRAGRGRASSARCKSCSDRGKAAFADARVYLERYVDAAAAHRGAGVLRHARRRVRARRARVQRAAPAPEDRRGDAVAGGVLRGRGGRGAAARPLRRGAARRHEASGYVGAGTCEFIADARGELFFLEVNARLQVEHPVTEMVTGLDLVELQLRVAAGEALPDLSKRRAARPRDRGARLRRGPGQGVHPEAGADRRARVGGRRRARCRSRALRVESGVQRGEQGDAVTTTRWSRRWSRGARRATRRSTSSTRALARDDDRAVHDEPRVPAQGPRRSTSSGRVATTRSSPRCSRSAARVLVGSGCQVEPTSPAERVLRI